MSVDNTNEDLYHSIDAHMIRERIAGDMYSHRQEREPPQEQMSELERTKGKQLQERLRQVGLSAKRGNWKMATS